MITLNVLNEVPNVRHGFFTREGGVSTGIYASRNCGPGSSDDPQNVAQNRAIAMGLLDQPPESLVTLKQAHTSDVVVVDRIFSLADAPTGDALVTDKPGIALGILTADCAPILFADSETRVIGAAHAGWRGALNGVVDATVSAMVGLGAKEESIVAVVGPCISQRSYEVGAEFLEAFVASDKLNENFFASSRRAGHFLFDLRGYVLHRLARRGIIDMLGLPADTCAEEKRFFSYRRATLKGEPDYGRQLSAIVIEE